MIKKQVFVDTLGNKHRLREKTLAEENMEKIENKVIDDFEISQTF